MEKKKKKKKGKWSVITQISLLKVLGVYGLLEKHRGQMAAPHGSRAVCHRAGAKFLLKSQFQIWELPTKVPRQLGGRSRRESHSAPPGFRCFVLVMLFF